MLDALALVAATGLGLVAARPFLAHLVATVRTIEAESLGDPYYWQSVLLETPGSCLIPSVLGLTSRWALAVLQGSRSLLRDTWGRGQVATIAQDLSVLAFPFLASWSFALLVLRLVAPRPPWRSLASQPGVRACGAAVGGILVASWCESAGVRLPPVVIPLAVGLSWLGLAIRRRWAAEGSWLDRLGRLAGLLWLALALPLGVWHAWCW